VARIPRVSGGGTGRAGQGAFGNQCRKGRMFAPTKIWRRWHRHVSINQRRFATVSALAASASTALVMARGHRVDQVAEIPLVVSNDLESISKTKKAVEVLAKLKADTDVERVSNSISLRAGRGKMRGRRLIIRRGPLIVYNEDHGLTRAFRNIRGVEVSSVHRLNLLKLAPGAHLGRFIIWTRGAFERLNGLFGSYKQGSTVLKDYTLPRAPLTNGDIARIINSHEVQLHLRPKVTRKNRPFIKKNPLRNLGVMTRLNPYSMVQRRAAVRAHDAVVAARAEREKSVDKKRKELSGSALKHLQRVKKTKAAHRPVKKLNFKRMSADE
jgi:large subunit ribosomal protein L4e